MLLHSTLLPPWAPEHQSSPVSSAFWCCPCAALENWEVIWFLPHSGFMLLQSWKEITASLICIFFSVSSFSDSSNLWKSARLPSTRKDWQNLIGLCTDVSTAHIYIVLFTCTHTRNFSSLCSATSCSQTHTKDCCKHKSCQLIWFFSVKNCNISTSWIKGVEAKLAENTSDTHTHRFDREEINPEHLKRQAPASSWLHNIFQFLNVGIFPLSSPSGWTKYYWHDSKSAETLQQLSVSWITNCTCGDNSTCWIIYLLQMEQ